MSLIRISFFVSLVSVLSLISQTGFAANGSELIGVSPTSRGMGGTGIGGGGHITESFWKNPAAVSTIRFGSKATVLEGGFTYLKLNTTANVGLGAQAQTGTNAVPVASVAYKWSDDLQLGLGLFGFSGVAVDFRSTPGIAIASDYKVTRIGALAAYKVHPSITVAIEPFLTYSELAIFSGIAASGTTPHGGVGAGVQLGVLGRVSDTWTAGLNFTTGSRVKHNDILDLDALRGAADGVREPFTITVPWEIGAGVNYQATENWKLALDYRFVGYSSSAGYSDYEWQNIHIVALGTEYKMSDWAWRAGFNYSPSPIPNGTGETGTVQIQGKTATKQSQSLFNIAAFPAFTQANLTVGAGYQFNEDLGLDLAFLYAPKGTRSRSGTALDTSAYAFTGTASQWALSAGVRYHL